MRLVIVQQVQQREEERQKERQRERENTVGLQRSKSLRVKGEGGKGFFSSLFKDKWPNICLTRTHHELKLQVVYCTRNGAVHRPHISIDICIYVYKKKYQQLYFVGIVIKPLQPTHLLVFQNSFSCFFQFVFFGQYIRACLKLKS